MANKNPGKLDIKSLQSRFEQTKQEAEPIVSHKRIIPKPNKDSPSFMQNRPKSIKPPEKGIVQHSQHAPSSGKAAPVPPTKTYKPAANFANELESSLKKAPKVRPERGQRARSPSPASRAPPPVRGGVPLHPVPVFQPSDDAPHDDLDKADSVPLNAPPPVPSAEDEPPAPPVSIVYKGKRLPSRVEVNGTMYRLTPLEPENGKVAPAKPVRPPEVVPIVPDDADDDEMYDNNRNLMGSISGGGGDNYDEDQNYEDCVDDDEQDYEGYAGNP